MHENPSDLIGKTFKRHGYPISTVIAQLNDGNLVLKPCSPYRWMGQLNENFGMDTSETKPFLTAVHTS